MKTIKDLVGLILSIGLPISAHVADTSEQYYASHTSPRKDYVPPGGGDGVEKTHYKPS